MTKYILIFLFAFKVFASDSFEVVKPRKYNLSEASALALAKEMCSCLFVSEQSEKYCKQVTRESRILAKYKVDKKNKRVHSKLGGFRAVGEFNKEKPRLGCKIIKATKYDRFEKVHFDISDYDHWKKYKRRLHKERLRKLGKR